MSDQIENVAAPEEQKSGSGVSGFVGGTVGLAAGGHFTKKYLQEKNIARVILNDPKKTEKYETLVNDAVAAKPELLEAKKEFVSNYEKVQDLSANPAAIEKVTFATDAAGKHTMTVHHGEVGLHEAGSFELKINKLPKDVTVGTLEDAGKIKTLFEGKKSFATNAVKKEGEAVLSGIGKEAGYFKSVKSVSLGEGALIAGGAVAAAVIGNKVFHAIAGGKHSNDVQTLRGQEAAATR